jgi:hypothetical protein
VTGGINGEAAQRNGSSTGFQVRLTNFEGPFDLLLQLIFAHRLDVTEVALHQVTTTSSPTPARSAQSWASRRPPRSW